MPSIVLYLPKGIEKSTSFRFYVVSLSANHCEYIKRIGNMLSVEELNDRLIDLAFAEDIGDGDHTTLCCIPADAMGKSKLLIKEEGVLAGMEIAMEVFRRFDPDMKGEVFIQDAREAGRRGHGRHRAGEEPVADGASDVEHHATYEWHCYHDEQVCGAAEGDEYPCAGHA